MTTLPDTPAGRELEEFFAALLQTTGHYVEKNIEERNILELDIAATNYQESEARLRLFEVKGTPPRLEDIFKFVGHMTYLGLREGAFIATAEPRDRELSWFQGVCQKTNVKLILVPDLSAAPEVFDAAGFGNADPLRHQIWRFSYWVERLFVKLLRDLRPQSPAAQAAIEYYRVVNSEVFLAKDPIDKLTRLYAAFQEHPHLTRDIADDLAAEREDADALIRSAWRTGRPRALPAAMYFEHRGRLSILKAATDYLVEGGHIRHSGDRTTIDLRIADLPQSFLAGLTWLQQQPRYWLFPLFWQNFLWAWGGLLPLDHRDGVMTQIEAASGMNSGDGANAMAALDNLFPTNQGWIRTFEDFASYQFVLMTPFHFQGVGAFHQLSLAGLTEYDQYLPTGQYTAQHFAARHNAAAALVAEAAGGA
jgi:hypothetical protein